MTIIQSLILGLIEGLTEFLPISSTAHLILGAKALRLPDDNFLNTFIISIQVGAILAVLILYWRRVIGNFKIIKKIITAFIPTALIGFIFYKIIKTILMDSLLVIAVSLIVGGLLIFYFEKMASRKYLKTEEGPESQLADSLETISYPQAFILGLVQALAVIPGVSRSGATIIGGLAQGIKRQTVVEFSFLLAIPTILAATVYDLYKNPEVLSGFNLPLWLIGFIVAFITALLGIKFFLKYIKQNDFKIFAWYRLILGLIILGVIFL
ncbi:MAG: undecaprenyl-diphosphate phosphatase [Patescibacteria group bacterium]|jgi:undecaprenyl-diphosphatase